MSLAVKKLVYISAILVCTIYACSIYLTGQLSRQRVEMDNVENCRQLGGYANKNGQTIRKDVLIRSGKLCKLDEDGLETLQEMGIRTVIDLRIPEEIKDKPDPKIDGVENIQINLADPKSNFYKMSVWGIGITKDNYESRINAIAKLNMNLGEMYIEGIIDSEYGRKALRKVFSILADPKRNAILWHCSGGKDRTGVVAALLLAALDVDRQTILDDYELTNEYVQHQRIVMKLASEYWGDDEREKERVATIAGVKREFMARTLQHIDKKYGSPMEFLTKTVGVSAAEIKTIKKKYLTDLTN